MIFKNKVVLVTGGASGIGKSIVKKFLNREAYVIFGDKDKDNGEKLIKELKTDKVQFYQTDFSDHDQIKSLFSYIKNKFYRLEILVNNVGISKNVPIENLEIDQWNEIINVNLRSFFITSKEFYKMNKNSSYGRIINIASTRAFMSEANTEAYSASKGGIIALSHSLAISFSKTNITVNCISPGWINTNENYIPNYEDNYQHPSKRVGNPEDVARLTLFLCDEKNDFINGENIIIDGGMTKKMIYL